MAVITRLLSLLAIFTQEVLSSDTRCRCLPNESCWPSDDEWRSLNSSVDGTLVSVQPFALPCHDPVFDAVGCDDVRRNGHNSTWRAINPGGVQWENWEALPASNQTCYMTTSREVPCGQGRVSVYSVLAKEEKHIQEAVRFAARHNLRLVIKNSGHDFLGRSAAPHSLQISTYRLKEFTFSDDFVTKGKKGDGRGKGPALTVGAGVGLKELYNAVGQRNLTVVAGFAHTVGVTGGYIQGGGHSPLGPWKGMASDNALEFEVVTAKGDLITANEDENPDLFWALRGGGGCTFGVVTSVTLRTFPDVPLVRATFVVAVPRQNATVFWAAVRDFHAHLPRLNDAGGSGYYSILPLPANATAESSLTGVLFFPNQTSTDEITALFAPLVEAWNVTAVPGAFASSDAALISWTRDMFKEYIPLEDTGGLSVCLASRLISRDFLLSSDGPTRAAEAFSKLTQTVGRTVTAAVVAGGAVARNSSDSAVNPAWRRTVTHIIAGQGWDPSYTSLQDQEAIIRNITEVDVPILKALEPDMGAYVNEADPNEADFQASFWGANYPRLYALKQAWDPQGLFIVRRGVGSEDWDAAGICRH